MQRQPVLLWRQLAPARRAPEADRSLRTETDENQPSCEEAGKRGVSIFYFDIPEEAALSAFLHGVLLGAAVRAHSGTLPARLVLARLNSWLRVDDMTKVLIAPGGIALALTLGLAACSNPYDPGQRAVGGGLIGAGAGAAIGGAAGGGKGAAIGAASGGALGAVTGAATTPPPPRYYGY